MPPAQQPDPEEPASPPLADQVAEGVAGDGAGHDHDDQRGDLYVAARRRHAPEDHRRLAGEDEADQYPGLGEHQRTDEGVGLPSVEVEERVEQVDDHAYRPPRSRTLLVDGAQAAVA